MKLARSHPVIHSMCEKCVQIDAQIERYRKIASDRAMDPLTRERVAHFVEDLKAEKAKLHSEPKEKVPVPVQ